MVNNSYSRARKQMYAYISLPLQYAKDGWPVLIPSLDMEWHFIKIIPSRDGYNRCFVEIPHPIKKNSFIIPLNQFDRGIENEEIIKSIVDYES